MPDYSTFFEFVKFADAEYLDKVWTHNLSLKIYECPENKILRNPLTQNTVNAWTFAMKRYHIKYAERSGLKLLMFILKFK